MLPYLNKLRAYENICQDLEKLLQAEKLYSEQAKELGEYKQAEEQGLILRLPCKAGDTVYFLYSRTEKQGRKKVEVDYVDEGTVDRITLGELMIPQIMVCDKENLWIEFDANDFGKEVFLTREAAEAKLAEMEGSHE